MCSHWGCQENSTFTVKWAIHHSTRNVQFLVFLQLISIITWLHVLIACILLLLQVDVLFLGIKFWWLSVDFLVFELWLRRLTFGRRKGSIPMPRTFHPTGRAYSLSRHSWRQSWAGWMCFASLIFRFPEVITWSNSAYGIRLFDCSIFRLKSLQLLAIMRYLA